MMATIVKLNYQSAARGGQKSALGSINYYAHRRDADGQQVNRTGFSRERDDLDAQAMKDLIGQSDGAYYYRVVLSPGAEHDTDVNLKDWTRDVLLELEGKHGEFPYVAIEHRDQTEYAHVHVVMVLDQKLNRAELDRLREVGTEIYESRRDWYEPSQSQARDIDRNPPREPSTNNEAFIAGYSDEPDDHTRRLRRNKSQSLDR
jgi:hypothetical protein